MSSGWPPEEDNRRWEPVRHASVVGAGHDSRGAERGYPGYARYTPAADGSGGFGPHHLPPGYGEAGWYPSAEGPGSADASHPSGPLHGTHGGYGGTGGADLYGAPVYTEAGYGDTGPASGPYEASQPAEARYEVARHGEAGYGGARHGAPEAGGARYGGALYAGGAYYAGAPHGEEQDPEEGYSAGRYAEDGHGPYGPDGSDPGRPDSYQPGGYEDDEPAGYGQIGYGPGTARQRAGHRGIGDRQTGYQETDCHDGGYGRDYQPAAPGQQRDHRRDYQPAAVSQQDYGYQDYGDPRYDDPSYGDLAYDDTPYPGSAHQGTAQARPSHPDQGYPDTGYGNQGHGSGGYPGQPGPGTGYRAPAYPAGDSRRYADGSYGSSPDADASAGQQDDGGYGEAVGYDDAEGYAEDPDHELGPDAARNATGMLDSSGLLGSVELYSYHPGAVASQGFLDAPTPVGTLDATGMDPSSFLDDTALGDHGVVLNGAEAGDATGVLGGSGFFDDADLAETSTVDLPPGIPGRGRKTGGTGALVRPRPGSRPAGRRRGRSGDRRLWFALAGVVIVFVGALVAIVMVAFPSGPGGPAHTLVTPNQLDAFTRRPALEQQMNVAQLRQDVVNTSSGQARHVVEAVYEAGNSTSGTTPQIILFIGGNLLNASPEVSVTSFTQRFKGAKVTSAGGPGEAACVNATASQPGSVAMCAWFDNDSFGEVVSPTMSASALANTMRQIRPHVELVAKQKQ